MEIQGKLYSGEIAQSRKEENLALVAANSGSWMDRIIDAARDMATSCPGEIVTGEALRQKIEPLVGPPHHPNAWGAAIATLVRNGTIRQTGRWVPMKSPKSHARRTPEYVMGN